MKTRQSLGLFPMPRRVENRQAIFRRGYTVVALGYTCVLDRLVSVSKILRRVDTMPLKRCSWGYCNSDSRYNDRPHMQGVKFIRFPQPKTQKERCLEWIRLCNRPHAQLNIDKITAYHYVCSKHFNEGCKDPVSACETDRPLKRRKPPKERDVPSKRTCSSSCADEEETSETITLSTTLPGGRPTDGSEILNFSFDGTFPNFDILLKDKEEAPTPTIPKPTSKGILCDSCHNTVQISPLIFKKIQRERFIGHIEKNDSNCFYYTGIPTVATLHFIFSWISPFISSLKLWDGTKKFCKKSKARTRTSLSYFEEFLLTLVRIRRGTDVTFLAYQFGISKSHVSRIFIAWVLFLDECFSELIIWPCQELNAKNMPNSFKAFPKTRAIIDCTEYFIQKPLMPHAQSATFSSYKHANTFKQLIAIMPSGAITFVSKLYGGNISDLAMVKSSGLLEKVEAGDDIMADRGFNIRHLLLERKATLNIPAFTHGKCLSLKALRRSRKIASVRIHVERAIRRMKTFKILSGIISLKLRFYLDSVTRIVAFLCNLQGRLAK